jgi:hypothetical protein
VLAAGSMGGIDAVTNMRPAAAWRAPRLHAAEPLPPVRADVGPARSYRPKPAVVGSQSDNCGKAQNSTSPPIRSAT